MSTFGTPSISFNDQTSGRIVTVTLNNMHFPNARVTFIDPERPDETNAQERARVLGVAKSLLQQAAASL